MSRKAIAVLLIMLFQTTQIIAQEILEIVKNGDLLKVKQMIENDITLLEAKDNAGRTAIHFAANSGHLEIVEYLLSKGINIDFQTKANTTPLHYAAINGFLKVTKLLVEKGADLEIKNTQTVTPLYYAAMRGHNPVLKYLIEQGAVVDALDGEQGTPLHAAARSGFLETVKILIKNGAVVKKKDTNGLSAIHFAARNGSREIIDYLKNCGIETGDADLFGKTPLYYAVAGGHKDVIDLLVTEESHNFNRSANDGNTYLHAAVEGGLIEFAELLISKGAKIEIKNVYGMSPLRTAIHKKKTEIADLLITKGAKKYNNEPSSITGEYLGQKKPGKTPELFAPGIISTGGLNERDASFSADGTEFYFSRWGGGKPFNILVMKKEKNQWTNPEPASFSSSFQDAEAFFTPDEQKIFFISNRPEGGTGNPATWEIYFVAREGKKWSSPTMLGSPFKGGFYTTFTRNWRMYYTQNGDLYRAQYTNGLFETPEKLGKNVNSEQGEYNSFVAPDESYLIFTSIRKEDNYGEGDLYICFQKKDGTWTKAINMGKKINSFTRDYCPSVSPDGKYFFFCSRKYGNEDIFWVETKVIDELRPDELK